MCAVCVKLNIARGVNIKLLFGRKSMFSQLLLAKLIAKSPYKVWLQNPMPFLRRAEATADVGVYAAAALLFSNSKL